MTADVIDIHTRRSVEGVDLLVSVDAGRVLVQIGEVSVSLTREQAFAVRRCLLQACADADAAEDAE